MVFVLWKYFSRCIIEVANAIDRPRPIAERQAKAESRQKILSRIRSHLLGEFLFLMGILQKIKLNNCFRHGVLPKDDADGQKNFAFRNYNGNQNNNNNNPVQCVSVVLRGPSVMKNAFNCA